MGFNVYAYYSNDVTFHSGINDPNVNEQTLDNLCGDLNKGYLPLNPTGQTVEGVSYPL